MEVKNRQIDCVAYLCGNKYLTNFFQHYYVLCVRLNNFFMWKNRLSPRSSSEELLSNITCTFHVILTWQHRECSQVLAPALVYFIFAAKSSTKHDRLCSFLLFAKYNSDPLYRVNSHTKERYSRKEILALLRIFSICINERAKDDC